MRRVIRRSMTTLLLALLMAAAAAAQQPAPADAPAVADPGGQVAAFLKVDPKRLIADVSAPEGLPADLKLELVDYIDCTKDNTGHPFLHDSLGRVAESPLGAYRETGPSAGSWFAYRFRVTEASKPHVIVLQFPDDGERITALAIAQPPSGDPQKPAARMEFGYRTGDLDPVSGRMLTRWTFFYPTGTEPPAIVVGNWHARRPAALARVWVYVVADNALPPAPDASRGGRNTGRYDCDPRVLYTRFGGKAENLVAAMDYLGQDVLGVDALQGRTFNYPSARFATGSNAIPDLLAAMAAGKKSLVAVFDPDCTAGVFTMPGEPVNVADISTGEARKAWSDFLSRDFMKVFGQSPAFAGIMLGGPQGAAAFDVRPDYGQTTLLIDLARSMARSPQKLYQNLGPASPHSHYFSRPNADWAPVGRWEASGESFDDCLARSIVDYWRSYGFEEDTLADAEEMVLMRQADRDDVAYYRFGHNPVPRYWLFDAAARSPGVTRAIAGSKLTGFVAAGTPPSRTILLRPGDFWWTWAEMAPIISPAGDSFFAPLTEAMAAGLEPWTVWLAGDGDETALHEEDVRRWMATYRSLPYRAFAPLKGAPEWPVAVRSYNYRGYDYVQLTNTTAAPVEVTVHFARKIAPQMLDKAEAEPAAESLTLTIPPWQLRGFMVLANLIKSVDETSADAEAVVLQRLEKFSADLDAARKAGATLGKRWDDLLKQARDLAAKKDYAALDNLLDVGLVREPDLRRRLLVDRPRADVPAADVTVDGRLDDWAKVEPIRLNTVDALAFSNYAANHWKGPADLSAELRLAWGDAGLYFALVVTDDAITADAGEIATLALSDDDYRSYASRPAYDFVLTLERGKTFELPALVSRREGSKTIHEGLIAADRLAPEMRPQAGRTIGFNLIVSDSDDRTAMPYSWCLSNLMAWSTRQDGYEVRTDAQAAGTITFQK